MNDGPGRSQILHGPECFLHRCGRIPFVRCTACAHHSNQIDDRLEDHFNLLSNYYDGYLEDNCVESLSISG
jgi:hypothetical protein